MLAVVQPKIIPINFGCPWRVRSYYKLKKTAAHYPLTSLLQLSSATSKSSRENLGTLENRPWAAGSRGQFQEAKTHRKTPPGWISLNFNGIFFSVSSQEIVFLSKSSYHFAAPHNRYFYFTYLLLKCLLMFRPDPGEVVWFHRCRIVPDGTTNCAGVGGILCVNNNYVTVSAMRHWSHKHYINSWRHRIRCRHWRRIPLKHRWRHIHLKHHSRHIHHGRYMCHWRQRRHRHYSFHWQRNRHWHHRRHWHHICRWRHQCRCHYRCHWHPILQWCFRHRINHKRHMRHWLKAWFCK